MLISEFAKAAELPVDTVRFYMRLGLLRPATSMKGGSRPYAIFSKGDFDRARKIRILQFLGYSLREIGPLINADANGTLTVERSKTLLKEQLHKLQERRRDLDQMIGFVKARIASLDEEGSPMPDFESYVGRGSHPAW